MSGPQAWSWPGFQLIQLRLPSLAGWLRETRQDRGEQAVQDLPFLLQHVRRRPGQEVDIGVPGLHHTAAFSLMKWATGLPSIQSPGTT